MCRSPLNDEQRTVPLQGEQKAAGRGQGEAVPAHGRPYLEPPPGGRVEAVKPTVRHVDVDQRTIARRRDDGSPLRRIANVPVRPILGPHGEHITRLLHGDELRATKQEARSPRIEGSKLAPARRWVKGPELPWSRSEQGASQAGHGGDGAPLLIVSRLAPRPTGELHLKELARLFHEPKRPRHECGGHQPGVPAGGIAKLRIGPVRLDRVDLPVAVGEVEHTPDGDHGPAVLPSKRNEGY